MFAYFSWRNFAAQYISLFSPWDIVFLWYIWDMINVKMMCHSKNKVSYNFLTYSEAKDPRGFSVASSLLGETLLGCFRELVLVFCLLRIHWQKSKDRNEQHGCRFGVCGKALLSLFFSLWCKVNLEDPCHHFGILRRVSDFFRNVYTIFLSVLWTLMKKQQDQHRLSSVLVIFRYLNGIQRANRSMNACDNIMSGRKREVATINPTGNFDLFLTDCYSCREPHASRRNVFEKHGNRSASQRSKHIAFWQLVGSPGCVQGSRLFLRSSPKINWEHWCVGSIYSGQCYWIHWSGAICYEIKKVV